ncbi:MAG: spherulation-specific family 4 protein [Nitrososphaerales archaeon]
MRTRSRGRLRRKAAVVLLVGSLLTLSFLGAVIIPLYSYPGVGWNEIIAAKEANPGVAMVVIINPDNGPGPSRDPAYVTGVDDLRAAGIIVLGYDHTSYAARSLLAVTADIDSYKDWYNLSGIFFDEMSSVPGNEGYYSLLNQYAKSVGLPFTVGNPGMDVPASYQGTMDVIVSYENQGVPGSASLASITDGMSKNNYAVIAYGVDTFNASAVSNIFDYANYVYVTNGTQPDPYGAVTGDLSKLVELIAGLGRAQTSANLTVRSVDGAGTPIVGLWTTVASANGTAVGSGYTPLTEPVSIGAVYTVSASNYGRFVFSHWSDGDTSPVTTLTLTQATTLTAYYGTSSSNTTTSSTSSSGSTGYSTSTTSSGRTTTTSPSNSASTTTTSHSASTTSSAPSSSTTSSGSSVTSTTSVVSSTAHTATTGSQASGAPAPYAYLIIVFLALGLISMWGASVLRGPRRRVAVPWAGEPANPNVEVCFPSGTSPMDFGAWLHRKTW